MNFPWYLAAFGAALVWGVHYPLLEHALRRLSLMSVLLLTALPIVAIAPLFHRRLGADLATLRALDWAQRAPILAIMLTALAGAALLFASIGAKNATAASLIEISYPLFVAWFGYLLFGHGHWNLGVLAGAALIFAGASLVIVASGR